MSARLAPLDPPFAPDLQAFLDRIMPPGVPPLVLFTTLARDARLFERFRGGGLLDKGHLTLRQREIVIGRVTAQCRSEYEWGVHTAFFAERVGLDDAMQRSLVLGSGDDPCWSSAERALIRACDELHATADSVRRSMGRPAAAPDGDGSARSPDAGRVLPDRELPDEHPSPAARDLREAIPGLSA